MPVVMIGEVADLTEDVYAGMLPQLQPIMQKYQGFIAHSGGPHPDGGWRVIEFWETEDDGRRWFEEHVAPNLPPGITPNRQYYPAHAAFGK
jgi:hypothetical protein